MDTAGTLVRSARSQAGLSMHALAIRAGVAYSTVSRIEHGLMDPTVGMLARLLEAAGRSLELAATAPEGTQLADLVDAWHVDQSGQERPDWTRVRAFLDALARTPSTTGPATVGMPPPSGSDFMDNLLAGIAEKLSDDAGLPRPSWTRRIRPLRSPWSTDGTPRMRALARDSTPEQLLKRGIVLRADSLWRDPSTVGLS